MGHISTAKLRGNYRSAETYGRQGLALWQGRQWAFVRLLGDSDLEAIEHYRAGKARDLLHSLLEKKDIPDETPSVES